MRRHPDGHAIVSVHDLDTSEDLEVALPWEHRDHWVGWGDRPRIRFSGNRWGIELSRGEAGIHAIDHEGRRWYLPEGSYQQARRDGRRANERIAMRKAEATRRVAMRKGTKAEAGADIKAAFGTMKGAMKGSFIDAMWNKIQAGEAIERKGPIEHKLRDAQKAGRLKSRDDVTALVESHYDTSHLAGSSADAISPAERSASAKNKPPAAGAAAPSGSGAPQRNADGSLRESADEKAQRQHAHANKELIQGGGEDHPSRSSPPAGGGSTAPAAPPASAHPSRPGGETDAPAGDGAGGGEGGAAKGTAGKKVTPGNGERWITVHPNGDDEKGVPVLIRPNPDGTHRIVGGADGKLNHLRLKGVKEPTEENKAEWAEKSKARRKKKKDADTERQAGQTDEQNEAEAQSKAKIKAAERAAERTFIEKVRASAGGVDEDLKPEALAKFRSEGARNLEVSRHHRKQFKQAMGRVRELAQAKVDQDLTHTERRVQIEEAIESEPALAENVRELAETELQLQAADDKERTAERRTNRTRTAGAHNLGEKAAEQARQVLEKTEDPAEHLKNLGGRVDPKARQAMSLDRLPSEEVERRAAQALQDALILHRAANGEELPEEDQQVLETIAKQHEIEPTDEDALRREAARQLRRSEIQQSQAKKLKDLESGGDERKAEIALAYTDMLKGIADDAKVARQLGLTEADKTPISEPEIAAIGELMGDAGKLREAKKQFKTMMQEAEGGDYDVSRRAFDLKVEDAPAHVAETEAELARQAITRRLLGIADPKSEAHIQAVAEGHYHALAEVGQGIGKSRYLDRPTMDAIGAKNACTLQRWALEQDGHDPKDVLEALETTHVAGLIPTSAKAIARAEQFVPDLTKTVEEVGDLEHALAQLDAHEQELDEVQREVGGALGKMEALATQAQAFRRPVPSHLEVQTGDQWDTALTWMHAAGLKPGDYEIDRKNKTIRIPQKAWGKLIQKEDPETKDVRAKVDAIKAGKHDEAGYLPAGFVSRKADTFTREVKGAQRFWEPLQLPEKGDLLGPIEEHVGRRIADGERPGDILADLNSAPILGQLGDGVKPYTEALRDVFPLKDKDGNLQRMDANLPRYRALAEKMVGKDHPGEAPLHAQSVDLENKDVQEAVYRTLTGDPILKLAHQPLTELSASDRGTLRDYFYKKMGLDPKRGYADRFNELVNGYIDDEGNEVHGLGPEPPKFGGTGGMFARPDEPSAEWKAWQNKALRIARMYPSEGRELALQALGERSKSRRSRAMTDEIVGHVDRLATEHPEAGPIELAMRARAAQAPELSEEEKTTAADGVRRKLHLEQQQWLERHPEATQQDAAKAFEKRAKSETERAQLEIRAKKGPPLNPNDVADYMAPHLHDVAVNQAKGWTKHGSPWTTYVEMHGSLPKAIEALQDELKGKFADKFREHHEKLTGKPIRVGKADITNRELHVFATASEKDQERYRAQRAEDMKAIQQRNELGQYNHMGGAGSLREAEGRERDLDRTAAQQQGGLFGSGGLGLAPKPKPGGTKTIKAEAPAMKLEPGERWTLGETMENQIRSVAPVLGRQLDSARSGPTLFPDANMDQDRIHQQRALKQLDSNGGRIGLYGGVGFGKTPVMFGGLTNAIAKGEAPHGGLFLVPAKVQPQFDSEMSSFLEPGKYKWQTGEDLSHDERVAMLANPDLHARVMTHASFMRTAQKILADHHGWKPDEVGEKLGAMSADDGAKAYRAAMDASGIPPMFTAVDEAHIITHRDSTDWGSLHALGRAATHPINASHAIFATATPHKNDASEVYSMASLVDPKRFADREAFMANFGKGIAQNPESIRRELSHLTYSAAIPPTGVQRRDLENPTIGPDGQKTSNGKPLPMIPEHKKLLDEVDTAYEAAAKAHAAGKVDVEAVKKLSPRRFEGVPEDQHEQLAKEVGPALGMVRRAARRRALELAPPEINTKLQAMTQVLEHDLKHGEWTDTRTGEKKTGKVPIVFANSTEAIELMRKHFESRGHRVETIQGETGSDQVRKVLAKFPRPEEGKERQADILIGSASMEAGLNAQFAQSIHHFDVPETEKAYNQRNGRAFRQNQRADVETHSWHADTPYDRAARVRLKSKTGLANVFQTSTPHLDESGIASTYESIRAAKHQGDDPESALAAK